MASIDVGMRSMVPVGQLHPHVENPFFRKKKFSYGQSGIGYVLCTHFLWNDIDDLALALGRMESKSHRNGPSCLGHGDHYHFGVLFFDISSPGSEDLHGAFRFFSGYIFVSSLWAVPRGDFSVA